MAEEVVSKAQFGEFVKRMMESRPIQFEWLLKTKIREMRPA